MNMLALLGWGPAENDHKSKEILGMDDLIGAFSLEGIKRQPAVVEEEAKLLWLNKHYYKEKLADENSLQDLAVQLQNEIRTHHK